MEAAMGQRRRTVSVVVGTLVGAAAIALIWAGFGSRFFGRGRKASGPAAPSASSKNPMAAFCEGLRNSDPAALAVIQQRAAPRTDVPPRGLSEDEGRYWLEVLSSVRTGYMRYGPPARATAVVVACRILDKFTVEPAPSHWLDLLQPLHDLFSASLADADPVVRYAALAEISHLWVWIPGRSLMPVEEKALAEWKGKIYPSVVRCLACRDNAQTRVAAVACLGTLPLDGPASPAIPYLEDPIPAVRQQILASYAQRPLLLSDDLLLARLHDAEATIRETARMILTVRGFKPEQIALGELIFSPRPEQRVSVIPKLKGRTDVDPVVWLILLSRDSVDNVRISAIEALSQHKTPAVERRLAEMARSDRSEAVRQAAAKFVPRPDETTVSLPPLPGSASLNPRAN
jgi:HEAT repeats